MWSASSHSSWQVNMNKVEQFSDSIYIYIFWNGTMLSLYFIWVLGEQRMDHGGWKTAHLSNSLLSICSKAVAKSNTAGFPVLQINTDCGTAVTIEASLYTGLKSSIYSIKPQNSNWKGRIGKHQCFFLQLFQNVSYRYIYTVFAVWQYFLMFVWTAYSW